MPGELFADAMYRGFQPLLSFASISAPLSISRRATLSELLSQVLSELSAHHETQPT